MNSTRPSRWNHRGYLGIVDMELAPLVESDVSVRTLSRSTIRARLATVIIFAVVAAVIIWVSVAGL